MSKAGDSAAVDHRGIFGEIEDFGQSALHTALESPINGAIQFIDHTANVHLPELNIIGAPTHNSLGAKAGAIVGAAADIVAISVATGGVADILGCAGAAGGIATAAATGAIYGGILTPTDNNSKHFFQDRLENGAITAATFGAMGGAARALGATGFFAVPEVRSLAGSLTFGGLSGAAGGLASAEATAVVKEHKALPSWEELTTSVGTQALFGAAYGGLGYAYNQLNGPVTRPTEMKSGTATITTVNDENGQPISFRATVPSRYNPETTDVVWKATKMTDGSWSSSGYSVDKGTTDWAGEAGLPVITNVTRSTDGTVKIADENGEVRTFAPGKYRRTNPEAEAASAAMDFAMHNYDRVNRAGEREIESSTGGYRKLDAQGRTLEFGTEHFAGNGASMKYDAGGSINDVSLHASGKGPWLHMERTGGNTWKFQKGDDIFTWQGKVEPIKGADGAVNALALTPENGKPMTFDTTTGTQEIVSAVHQAGQYQGISPTLGWAKVSPNGEITLKAGQATRVTVNGQNATGEVTVRPGDNVHVQVDVGDRYAIWEDRPLKIISTPDGKITINGKPVSNRPIELSKTTIPKPQESGRD